MALACTPTPKPLSSAPMPRLSRRFVAALLWIAIALLPLRGFAAAVMPALMASAPAAEAQADDVALAVPCHGDSHDTDATAAPADSTHTCSLCDLCHSSVALAPPTVLALTTTRAAPPRGAAPPAIEPRAPDGLFRPPRAHLA